MGRAPGRLSAQFDGLGSILCVGAHPDDIEIGCGGSILELLHRHPGVDLTWVVLSGDKVRHEEARRAATAWSERAAGCNLILESFTDSFFPYEGRKLKEFFHRLRREVEPDLVFTHRREDQHQDHRTIGELTWNAFRDQLILEYEIPKYEGDLGRPNLYTVLDEATCQRKIGGIREHHVSQAGKPYLAEQVLWATLRLRGLEAAAPTGLAEGLYSRKLTI